MKELSHLNKYFIKYKYRFLAGIIITIVAQIFKLYVPKFFGDSLRVLKTNTLNNEEIRYFLVSNLFLTLLAALAGGFLTFLMRQTIIVMSRHIEFDLKNEIFHHYQNLSQNFYKQNRIGDLMSRISEDVSKVRMYVGPSVMYSVNTLITFIVVITQMILISPQLTLYTLLPLPLLSVGVFKISSKIHNQSEIFQQNLSKLSSFTQEMFSGIRVIKAYAIEKEQNSKFQNISSESRKKSLDLAKTNSYFLPLMILLIGLSNLLVIFIGGKLYINGKIPDIGIIAEFILYINMLTWPVASLGWVSSLVQEAEASQKRINEFLKTKPEIINYSNETFDIKGKIEFKKVSYTYSETKIKALTDVSFSINPGETLAILGKTGSGKSTILSLLARLYDCNEGEILIDNIPLQKINLIDLRKNIGVVPQDSFLFSDTIKNNIKFGNENAKDEDITSVAKLAAVEENIKNFPEKYETLLGERGITLSGGQKQRISIARALIKQAPILLLDDCLSAVDTETEETILKNLEEYCKNRTTILVSHRISSVKNANQIIILDQGKIIQQGTHNQLLSSEGYYKDLYIKQLTEKEIA